MRITIESLSRETRRNFGFTPMAGYRVVFSSGALRAGAWFVPADDDLSHVVGQSYDVEVNHERVSELAHVQAAPSATTTLSALATFACFQVVGRVVSAQPPNEHGGQPFAFVEAGGTCLALSAGELAGFDLKEGDAVTFVAHDLSLWNEAI